MDLRGRQEPASPRSSPQAAEEPPLQHPEHLVPLLLLQNGFSRIFSLLSQLQLLLYGSILSFPLFPTNLSHVELIYTD